MIGSGGRRSPYASCSTARATGLRIAALRRNASSTRCGSRRSCGRRGFATRLRSRGYQTGGNFRDRHAQPQRLDNRFEVEGMPQFLPADGLDQLRRQDPVAVGHVGELRAVKKREEMLEDPVAEKLDLRVAVERPRPGSSARWSQFRDGFFSASAISVRTSFGSVSRSLAIMMTWLPRARSKASRIAPPRNGNCW